MSWSLGQPADEWGWGLGAPGTSPGLLMDGARFQVLWLQGPGGPRAGV